MNPFRLAPAAAGALAAFPLCPAAAALANRHGTVGGRGAGSHVLAGRDDVQMQRP